MWARIEELELGGIERRSSLPFTWMCTFLQNQVFQHYDPFHSEILKLKKKLNKNTAHVSDTGARWSIK